MARSKNLSKSQCPHCHQKITRGFWKHEPACKREKERRMRTIERRQRNRSSALGLSIHEPESVPIDVTASGDTGMSS